MFDIGFSELVLIAIVGLLVIGPERLPGTIRTGAMWLNRLKRGFNEIKQEVQQELHNDSVMQELRKTGEQLRDQARDIDHSLLDSASQSLSDLSTKPTPGSPEEPQAGTKEEKPQ